MVLGTFFIFLLSGYLDKIHNRSVIPNSTSHFQLEYVQKTKIDGDLLQVIAEEKTFQEKVLVRYKIKSLEEKEALTNQSFYGLICNISGDLKEPSLAKNPNAFDYRKYLATKKIFWVIESQTNLELSHLLSVYIHFLIITAALAFQNQFNRYVLAVI
jgi:competence protein ComEC